MHQADPDLARPAARLPGIVESAAARLERHRDEIDALNVYPVPDGDTGSNMALTMRGAVDAGRRAAVDGAAFADVARAMARGALLEARGNSGVILSQWLAGLADRAAGETALDGAALARALAAGQQTAYRAVVAPQEGTMLTVARAAAEAAAGAADETAEETLAAALAGAREVLRRTPEQLEPLRRAGVVDAGGQGIVRLLEGALAAMRGEAEPSKEVVSPTSDPLAGCDAIFAVPHEDGWGYCTNFLVVGSGIDVERARRALGDLGTSAVVVGDGSLLKVHLHTANPGAVLERAIALGELDQIRIDNLGAQTRARAAALPRRQERPAATVGVVAVAAGEGMAAALRFMGAGAIVPGGQTMNPSVAALLAGIAELDAAAAIVLPNNPNVALAAERAGALAEKPGAVVPSRSVPQGLAALAVFDPEDGLEANVARMTAAMGRVRTVELTAAVRDSEVDGVAVREGETIALVDGRLAASGPDEAAALRMALAVAGADRADLLTFLVGVEAGDADVARWRAVAAEVAPDAAFEAAPGGQPHYRAVVAVE